MAVAVKRSTFIVGTASSHAFSRGVERTTPFWRLSDSFLRSFSAAPSPASPADPAVASASTKPKRRKKKNLFEVAQFLPNFGIGYHMAKAHWRGISYEITKINLYKDGKHGKAWGIVHKEGSATADAPRKISGVHKRCWKYIKNVKAAEETPTATEVQAA